MDLSTPETPMRKPPSAERLFIDGSAGRLEAILELPAEQKPLGSAVVCHPHPQHGGTMHNKVAHTLARAFVRSDFAVLRFNFRGTEQSEGEFDNGNGELDDALAAILWMRERTPATTLWLAGFSFGAAIAVKAAVDPEISGLISVAPAISRFATGLASQPTCPWLIVQGDQDELVDVEETVEWVDGLEPGPELLIIPGGEHFFHGRLVELREAVSDFVARSAS
jgi:alpha/beta superfamily hydrolase